MAGTITEDYGMSLRSSATEGMLSEQRCLSGDSIAEWRSSEQVENGTASTSPPYWDTDDDDDCGPKPLELYGRFTWKIESFSTINKRELRSNAFEVGGYKWYILIYPQGCDVCNHLSLFLCVANHDKLLPGWSHFAQFTIAVVNKDPKKSKYSDTLHRFWKKEHDWGWKKFMELSKVYDGFVVADTLVIKAQVQVIRERTDRPFRCLDCQYRRELVRVYLSNVEQICRRFLEERIGKLNKFVEDKAKWPSFRAFWLGIDSNARRRMSRDKTDAILKVVVKHFFIEKEVTSTLVMDSLYSGLKALEFQNKNIKGSAKLIELEELPSPMVHIDQDFFVLADDVIVLIERVVSDSLSHQPLPSKDDKCLQNRTKMTSSRTIFQFLIQKYACGLYALHPSVQSDGIVQRFEDGSSDEFNKDAVERDERRLMELGRKTIEIFVLLHIFSSRIEVSYQEAVALKRQEELIREEEAAGQAENELKSKRIASDKEKRAKKKQTKQKRNGRKGKEKVKDERFNPPQERLQRRSPSEERSSENSSEQVELVVEKNGTPDDTSDVSDTGDDGVDVIQPDLDDRASSPTNWDTDTSEIHRAAEASGVDVQNSQIEKRSQSVIDDSSSTCSTDSIPSALVSGSSKDSAVANNKLQPSTNRGKNHWSNEKAHSIGLNNGVHISQPETTLVDLRSHDATSSKVSQTESDTTASSLKSEMLHLEKNIAEKEEFTTVRKKVTSKDPVDADRQSPSPSLCRKPPANIQQTKQSLITIASLPVATTATELASSKDPSSGRIAQTEKVITLASRSTSSASSIQTEAKNLNAPIRISSPQQTNATSRPSSAPLIAAPRATAPAPISSTVQVVPLLSRSVSATGRLGNDPSQSASAFVPQSYRNAIMGRSMNSKGPVLIDDAASSSQSVAFSRSVSSVSMLPPQTPIKKEQVPIQPGLTFGCLKPEVVHTQQLRGDDSYHGSTTTTTTSSSSSSNNNQRFGSVLTDNMGKLDIYGKFQKKQYSPEIASVTSCIQGTVAEEFPHLDIINDLLDDDQHIGRSARSSHHAFSRQFSLPGNLSTADVGSLGSSGRYDQSEYFEEGFPRGYGASINLPQGLREEHFHHMDISAITNSRYDGLMRSQWPYRNADQSTMFSLGDGDANGYGYHLREYFARRGNGYLYRPNEP